MRTFSYWSIVIFFCQYNATIFFCGTEFCCSLQVHYNTFLYLFAFALDIFYILGQTASSPVAITEKAVFARSRLPNFSAGKFPSAITISSPCPISQSVFNNSGDTIFGMFFNIILFFYPYNFHGGERKNNFLAVDIVKIGRLRLIRIVYYRILLCRGIIIALRGNVRRIAYVQIFLRRVTHRLVQQPRIFKTVRDPRNIKAPASAVFVHRHLYFAHIHVPLEPVAECNIQYTLSTFYRLKKNLHQ